MPTPLIAKLDDLYLVCPSVRTGGGDMMTYRPTRLAKLACNALSPPTKGEAVARVSRVPWKAKKNYTHQKINVITAYGMIMLKHVSL